MKVLVISLLFFFISSNCGAQTISTDDKLHFVAGAIISAGTYTYVYNTTKNKKKAFWYSLGSSAVIGLFKEIYDGSKSGNRFDTGEAVITTIGGLTASVTFQIFVGKRKNEK